MPLGAIMTSRIRCSLAWSFLAIAALFAAPNMARATHPSPLPDTITTPNQSYVVNFTNDNPYAPPPGAGADLNFFSTTQAQNIANAFDNANAPLVGTPNGYHAGYANLGFLAPSYGGSPRQAFVFDCAAHGGCDSGNAPSDRINFPATGYLTQSEACLRLVAGHELFHHEQYAYITFGNWTGWGNEPVEGTARYMQDKVYSDLDADAGCITYLGEVNNYLGNPNQTMWNLSYTTALFWNYLGEQLGSVLAEPTRGADFVRRFWERAGARASSPDFVGTLRNTVADFDVSRSLENLFHDFAIANYTKNLDVSLLPDGLRYRYADENDGTGSAYNAVMRTWTGTIPPQQGPTASSVVRWGARYFEANVSAGPTGGACSRGIVGFRSTGDSAAYALVGVKGTNQVDRIVKSVGGTFAKAFIQRTGAPYTRLGAVVAGLSEPANFTYTFACAFPQMSIVEPTNVRQAFVGTFDHPERFLVKLRVFGPPDLGTPSVEGLEASDFQVFVGADAPANEAPIVNAAYVQGEYWIVAQAPTKGANGTFDLLVKLRDVTTAGQNASIRYELRVLDQVLVIDRSGSMNDPVGSPKIDAAKNAATLFVDAAGSQDRIGAVSFSGDGAEPNDDATINRIMQPVTDAQRGLVRGAIAGIGAGGWTSIGDGLEKGRNEFVLRGSALGEDWLVLLSDGMENEAQYWANVRANIQAANVKVNAIALGPQTDQALLQAIAAETGGIYSYVDVAGGGAAPDFGGPLANRLGDAYAVATEHIRRHERLWETRGIAGAPQTFPIVVQEGGIEDAVFSFNWSSPGDVLGVEVHRPGGALVTDGVLGARVFSTPTHVVVQLPALSTGTWEVRLQALAGAPEYLATLSGKNREGASLALWFGQYHDDGRARALNGIFLRGLPMPILASLGDKLGPVRGANVEATIEHPDGSTILIPLFDDGSHGDGPPNDGVYGNFYTRTTAYSRSGLPDVPASAARGSYNVVLEAQGNDNASKAFARIRKGSFQIYDAPQDATGKPTDSDQDGMPDRYEALHACLDVFTSDGGGDPDADELTNFAEWDAGTDPCSPDTDRGGESDRSELSRGANVFDPRDDALPRPEHAAVVDTVPDHQDPPPDIRPNSNLIRFPVHPSYVKMRLMRSPTAAGPWPTIATFPAVGSGGLHRDDGLVNGTPYFYRIAAEDLAGHLSAPSEVFRGTPKAEPMPPLANVQINDGAALTTSLAATLTLTASPDVTLMALANGPTFAGAVVSPFATSVPWTLVPDPSTGIASVYALFADAAGNVSRVYEDEIRVVPVGSVGGIRGRVLLGGGLVSFDGTIALVTQGGSDAMPAFTNAAGVFTMTPLIPGVYDIVLEHTGFTSMHIASIAVPAGAPVNIGTFTLMPFDTDADGVPDAIDNCPTVPNAGQQDLGGIGAGSLPDGLGDVCQCGDVNGDGRVTFTDAVLVQRATLMPPTATLPHPELCDVASSPACTIADAVVLRRALLSPPTATIEQHCVPALPY